MKNSEKRILIAASEPEVREALITALQGLQELLVASDAEDARRLISGENCFIAFVGERFHDFNARDALDVTRKMRQPVCIVSVCTTQDQLRDAELLDQGAEAVITFPFHSRLPQALATRAFKIATKNTQVSEILDTLRTLYLSFLGYDCPGMGNTDAITAMCETEEPVLIVGERGTGKELLARAIHLAGRRALGPFEVVSARRISWDENGATLLGDRENPGAMGKAQSGAFMIHGIGEVPLPAQEKLLGIIKNNSADTRFMFTTRIDLHGAGLRGEFSSDLWELLEKNSFYVPALRERPEAIPVLAKRLLDQYSERLGSPARNLHTSARDMLVAHRWPGNLLELEKVIVLGVARASGPLLVADDLIEIQPQRESISLDHLSLEEILYRKLRPLVSTVDELSEADLHDLIVSRVERPLLSLVMEKVGGNQIKAARALGIHRNTLRTKLNKLGLKPKGDR